MKKCNARGSAARDPHGIKQITVGPPHGIKQITMFIRENVECLDSSFTTTTTIKRPVSLDSAREISSIRSPQPPLGEKLSVSKNGQFTKAPGHLKNFNILKLTKSNKPYPRLIYKSIYSP
ncbi:hypothetical protein J6590_084028 [Homalodisca vitripennis]|nr:hypothetical protein J6590_084028 [Homalodisca vitripennis]